MDEIKKVLIGEAEELEKLSKIELKRQNYEEAISLLFQAKEKYEEVGLTGQVSILIKKIANLKNKIKTSPNRDNKLFDNKIELEVNHKENLEGKGIKTLGKAYDSALKGELDTALDLYNQAYNLYKKLNYDYECRQILWQINEIKEHQRWTNADQVDLKNVPIKDIVSLSQAEKRRRKIQEQLAAPPKKDKLIKKEISFTKSSAKKKTKKKKPKLFQQIHEQEKQAQLRKTKEEQIRKEIQDIRLQKIREKQEKLQKIKQQKQTEEDFIKEANKYLDQANDSLKNKEYDKAKELYTQSINIFANLGWQHQVRTLNQELRNIEIYKKEDARKLESEKKFEKRVSTVLNEKERYVKKQTAEQSFLSPEIKLKLEKAEFTKQKAEKEENTQNFKRALARYEYILNLYKSIPQDIFDTSDKLTSTQKKISELKEKM